MAATEKKTLWKKIKDRQSQLAEQRRPYEGTWDEVNTFLRPELSARNDKEPNAQGKKPNIIVYNASPEEGLETWADGMQGNSASAGLGWFRYAMANKELDSVPEVRKWLQDAEQVVYGLMRESNYYSTLNPIFRAAGSIGNAPNLIEKNRAGDGIASSSFHSREVFIAEDWSGNVNVWHRKYEMTAIAAADMFGKDNLSAKIGEDITNHPFARHKFIHAVYEKIDPIFDGETGLPDRKWISVYIEVNAPLDKQKPLRRAGYFSKSFAYWRTSKASDAIYGYGPGTVALVDIYALNGITRTMLRAGHLMTDAPMLGSRNLRPQAGNIKPGGKLWKTDPTDDIVPINSVIHYPAGVDREQMMQQAIDRRFNVDFFLMLQRAEREKTAFETSQLIGERATLLSPKIGRMESDLLTPNHDRIFDIAMTEGWFPPPPAILLDSPNGKIDVTYLGPLAQAQRQLLATRRTQQVVSEIAPFVELDPSVLDNFDMNKTVVRIAQDGSWPQEEIRPEEEVAAIRQQRAEAAAEDRRLELLGAMADKVPALATGPEPGSPLEQMQEAEA